MTIADNAADYVDSLVREWHSQRAYFYGSASQEAPTHVFEPPAIGPSLRMYCVSLGAREQDIDLGAHGLRVAFPDGSVLRRERHQIDAQLFDSPVASREMTASDLREWSQTNGAGGRERFFSTES